jgi:hypothetical protein
LEQGVTDRDVIHLFSKYLLSIPFPVKSEKDNLILFREVCLFVLLDWDPFD